MNLPSPEQFLRWTWESVLKQAVTTAVNAAWTFASVVLFALFGLSVASDPSNALENPLQVPAEVGRDIGAIVDGMSVLTRAANFYLKSNGQ